MNRDQAIQEFVIKHISYFPLDEWRNKNLINLAKNKFYKRVSNNDHIINRLNSTYFKIKGVKKRIVRSEKSKNLKIKELKNV